MAPRGKVIAFEADPYNQQKLLANLSLNGTSNCVALNVGVSDKHETLSLGLNTSVNRGGNSFLQADKTHSVEVECKPLYAPLTEQNNGLRLLAIDDDADTLDITRQVLMMYRADITTARSAGEALELLGKIKFDVLLSDIGMPGEDGFSLITKVRNSAGPNRDIPASSVTEFARSQDREKAHLSGFDAHLVKPIEPGALVAVVISLVQRRSRKPA